MKRASCQGRSHPHEGEPIPIPYAQIRQALVKRGREEDAHDVLIKATQTLERMPLGRTAERMTEKVLRVDDDVLSQRIFGVHLQNPVGLACFDKNARFVYGAQALGFGFTEIGAVTIFPQRGNPRPRIFAYPKQGSMQNFVGFANEGMDAVARRLQGIYHRANIAIGVNLGRGKDTPNEMAIGDYVQLAHAFSKTSDYLTINISSPNTVGLRDLQNVEFVASLVRKLSDITGKPILVKLSPDMEPDHIIAVCRAAADNGAKGLVLTNTTTDYSLLPVEERKGGLSGHVLRPSAFNTLWYVSKIMPKIPKIYVGGVETAQDAYKAIVYGGASAVELYTGLALNVGPLIAWEINKGLRDLLRKDGFRNINEAVGCKIN